MDGLSAQSNPQSNSQSNSDIERALLVAASALPLALALLPAPSEDSEDSCHEDAGIVGDTGGGNNGGDSDDGGDVGDGGQLLSSLVELLRAYWSACAKHGNTLALAPAQSNAQSNAQSIVLSNAQSNAQSSSQSNAALSAISREQQLYRRRQQRGALLQWEIRALQTCLIALSAAARPPPPTTKAATTTNNQSTAKSNPQSNFRQSNDALLLYRAYDASVAVHAYLLILGGRGRDRYIHTSSKYFLYTPTHPLSQI